MLKLRQEIGWSGGLVPKSQKRNVGLAGANTRRKEGGTVKMNKSKAEPVSSWCYQRQAGPIKVHRRVVWSLIFLVYGVYLIKAEVREDHAREVHPDHQDGVLWMEERMTMWEDLCLKQKKGKTARERTQEPLKKTVKVETSVPTK